MQVDSIWKEKYIGRKPNQEIFSVCFSPNGTKTNEYIYYMAEDDYPFILNLYVYLDDGGEVVGVETYKAKELYSGPGRPVNQERSLSKKDIKAIEDVLDTCLVDRYSHEVDLILSLAIKKKVSFENYTINKISLNSVVFTTNDGTLRKLKTSKLCDAIELSHVYLEILYSIDFLMDNSDYFGLDNIPMIWAILSVVNPKTYANYSKINKQYRYRSLLKAVEEEDISLCQEFVDVVSMNFADSYNAFSSPLMSAVKKSNEEICQWLLDNGANPNEISTKSYSTRTVMEQALKNKDEKILVLLLRTGKITPPEQRPSSSYGTPIYTAVKGKNKALVSLLLENGYYLTKDIAKEYFADLSYDEIEKILPYNIEFPAEFLSRVIEDKKYNFLEKTALKLKESTEQEELLATLVEHNEYNLFNHYINLGFSINNPKIMLNCLKAGDNWVEVLMKKGFNVDINDGELLNKAVCSREYEMCKRLLNLGAATDLHEKYSSTLLYKATVSNEYGAAKEIDERIIRLLLDNGANPFFTNEITEPIQRNIIVNCSEDLCKHFIDIISDTINTPDSLGHTLIYYAVSSRDIEDGVFDYLIQKGADLNVELRHGETLLSIAALKGKTNICKRLIELGLDVNKKETKSNSTALHCAAIHGDSKICELLIEAGAEINAVDNSGSTPLDKAKLAIHCDHSEVINVLVKHGAICLRNK